MRKMKPEPTTADLLEILATGANGTEYVDITWLLERAAKELREKDEALRGAGSDVGKLTAQLLRLEAEGDRRPKWNGGFEEARYKVLDIVEDHLPPRKDFDIPIPEALLEALAEALVRAFDSGVAAEFCAKQRVDAKGQP